MAGPEQNRFVHPRQFGGEGQPARQPPELQQQCFFLPPTPGALGRRDSLPLVFEMPTGQKKQVNVPVNASVDDLLAALNADEGVLERDEIALGNLRVTDEQEDQPIQQPALKKMLSFNGVPMTSGRAIKDYNIPAAYEGAASMLWTIGEGGLDLENAASAINSTAEVANHISMGINDVDDLVKAALGPQPMPSIDPTATEGPENISDPPALLRKLSRKAPHLFQAEAVEHLSKKYLSKTPVTPPVVELNEELSEQDTNKAGSTWLEELSTKFEILGDREPSKKRPEPSDTSHESKPSASHRKVKRKTFAATYQEKLDSMQRDNEALEEQVKSMREAVERLQEVLTVRVLNPSD